MDAPSNVSKPVSSSDEVSGSACTTTTPSPVKDSNDITGILKVEKVGPVFRIVDPYAAKLPDASSNKRKADFEDVNEAKRIRGDLFAEDVGPFWHKVVHPMMTPPIVAQNLWRQFEQLPIFGTPEKPAALEETQNKLLREYVGLDLDDNEWASLEKYCSISKLKTRKHLTMGSIVPMSGRVLKSMFKLNDFSEVRTSDDEEEYQDWSLEDPLEKELCIVTKFKELQKKEAFKTYIRSLKYRGVKQLPAPDEGSEVIELPPDLVPGRDTLYRIRVYRPFGTSYTKEKQLRGRHSVFNYDIVTVGRLPLTTLRDRFPCRNDVDLRVDLSACPERATREAPQSMVRSGFLFINDVFYVDGRDGAHDTSRPVRRWAAARGMGAFPVRRMEDYTLDDVLVKLAHPEVYVHQGNCEHLFLFSEVRLLNRSDVLHLASYPAHFTVAQNQTLYCTTCVEYGAEWLVLGTDRLPFNPALFCKRCFVQYLYKDNQKVDNFKAFPFTGNDLNMSYDSRCNIKYVMNFI